MNLDHLIVSCGCLKTMAEGLDECFSSALSEGGKHEHSGTHNSLLCLSSEYVELVAIDRSERLRDSYPLQLDELKDSQYLLTGICLSLESLDEGEEFSKVIYSNTGIKLSPQKMTRVNQDSANASWVAYIDFDLIDSFRGMMPLAIYWESAHPLSTLKNSHKGKIESVTINSNRKAVINTFEQLKIPKVNLSASNSDEVTASVSVGSGSLEFSNKIQNISTS